MKTTTKTVLIGAWVKPGIHGRISDLAWQNRRSISAELRLAIEDHLAKAEQKQAAVAA